MPATTAGPALLIEPPLAFTPLTVGNSRFVSGDQNLASARQFSENGRGAEIEVGSIRVGTDRRFAVRTAATCIPDILLRFLADPFDLAGGHVHGHDRIGKTGGGRRVVVAGTDVESVSLHVESGRIPNCRSGRAHNLHPRTIFLRGLGFSDDGVSLPNLFAAGRIQGY